MNDVLELRKAYRKQHAAMTPRQNDITRTTRRQRAFRPRGRVYADLIRGLYQ